ncbi:hypothetical protein LCGC14_0347530 [marine sediment metagenome]|uniref:Uncharacterized protein n=1 Tax=marine sediment metagenome TaxID=412755 RepID=A0A0F9VZ59_9ZZZZ
MDLVEEGILKRAVATKDNEISLLQRRIISLENSLTRQRRLGNISATRLRDLRDQVLEKIKESKIKLYTQPTRLF